MIKKLCEKLLLIQQEFADLSGVSFITVNRWGNGHNSPNFKNEKINNITMQKQSKNRGLKQ